LPTITPFSLKATSSFQKAGGGPRRRGGAGNSGEAQRINAWHNLRNWMERKGSMHPSIVSRLLRIGHNGAMNTPDWADYEQVKDEYAESVQNCKFLADQYEHFNRPFRMLPADV
jgi:hypothetical protein